MDLSQFLIKKLNADMIADMQNTVLKICEKSFDEKLVVDPCVFKVPKSLRSVKPEAYSPQLVGLAPYHHLDAELWDMERVKVDAAIKIQKKLKRDGNLDELIARFKRLGPYICVCYNMFAEDNNLLLARIMVIDALFLFGIICLRGVEKTSLMAFKELRELAELSLGNKLAEDAILRDVMMLENQIPIFIMEKILLFECPSNPEIAKAKFPQILVNFCGAVSPFKSTHQFSPDKALKRAHLLDLLYHMIVPSANRKDYKIDIPEDCFDGILKLQAQAPQASSMEEAIKIVSSIATVPILDNIAPPLGLLGELLKLPVSSLTTAFQSTKEAIETDVEDIPSIPTASSLSKVGITFGAADHIKSTSFDKTAKRFQLPVMKLGVNSEVIIRNLVAYEAMIEAEVEDDDPKQTPNVGDRKPKSNEPISDVEAQVLSKDDEKRPLMSTTGLVLARHMELMNELIETTDDAQVLKDQGIIISNLKNEEIANLFDGMSKSIELSHDSKFEQIIKDISDVYNSSLRVKCSELLEHSVYACWRILLVILALCYLVLLILQAFCNAYNCPRILKSSK